MKYIDVHSHIAFPIYDGDRDLVLKNMREKEVAAITVGVDLQSSRQAVALADRESDVFATIGLHPNHTADELFDEVAFKELLKNKKVVGVGECGLDYFRRDGTDDIERKRQHDQFEVQVAFACEHDLPLMIHCRASKGSDDAFRDLIGILENFQGQSAKKPRGNMHFFTGDRSVAEELLLLDLSFSFNGVLTFARDYDEVVRFLPQEALLTETDCPYVAPHPHRGERNESSLVPYVAHEIARIRGVDEASMVAQLRENACRVFSGMLLLPP